MGSGPFHPLHKTPEERSRVSAPQLSVFDAAVRQQSLHNIEREIQVLLGCCILILWTKRCRKVRASDLLLVRLQPRTPKAAVLCTLDNSDRCASGRHFSYRMLTYIMVENFHARGVCSSDHKEVPVLVLLGVRKSVLRKKCAHFYTFFK